MRYEVLTITPKREVAHHFSSLKEAKKFYRQRRTYYKSVGEIALHDLKESKTLLEAKK